MHVRLPLPEGQEAEELGVLPSWLPETSRRQMLVVSPTTSIAELLYRKENDQGSLQPAGLFLEENSNALEPSKSRRQLFGELWHRHC